MQPPAKVNGSRLCITITEQGVSAYGNTQAFQELSEWMLWLSKSKESEHFECHVRMSLENDDSKFFGKKPNNVWVLTDKKLSKTFQSEEDNVGFELTFMVVENSDLDVLAKQQDTGLLPDDWNSES